MPTMGGRNDPAAGALATTVNTAAVDSCGVDVLGLGEFTEMVETTDAPAATTSGCPVYPGASLAPFHQANFMTELSKPWPGLRVPGAGLTIVPFLTQLK